MGNDHKTGKRNSSYDAMMNLDVKIKGDINVYVCGNINTFLNCKDGFNFTASRNYYALEQIFEKSFKTKEETIQLKGNKEIYFQYEFRKKEGNKKQYNAFLFLNKADKEFLDILFEHLYELDKKNENKNVVIFFGEEKDIIKCFENLNENSDETVPFLIIVDKSKYSDKLNYVNHIPDLDTIENILKEEKLKLSEDELSNLSIKALVNYINMKLFRIDMYYNQLGYNLNLINPMNEVNLKIRANVTIGLFGYSGCGKSSLINLIFDELVARTSTSSTDVTNKCSEYYLPIKETNREEIGQIRFLDCPGISENENYNIIEPEVKKKLKEYKKNMEQIDVALFFITNGNNREFTKSGLKLVNLLHEKKIKIIFVINGPTDDFNMKIKKQKLRNSIENKDILYEDCSNVIFTNFYQYLKGSSKKGIAKIFQKIIEEIRIKDEKFNVEDINISNYNEKLKQLSKYNRIFEEYGSMNAIKEKAKIKADLTVTGYSLLSLGSSALSLVVPLADCALTIGYQIAMVYNVLSIYELSFQDYDIVKIILSGGDTIELKQKIKSIKTGDKKDEINKKENKKVAKGTIREVIKDASNTAINAGKYGIERVATKEAGKMIAQKTVETVMTDTINAAGIKVAANSVKGVLVNSVEVTMEKTVEKIAIESTKELAEAGLKEGTKVMVDAAKNVMISMADDGGEQLIMMVGTKQSVKTITETVVLQQGGKTWLINLGKAVPFIGAALSAVMNTFSIAKLGKKLVDKFNDEFDNNQQRQVDLLKGRIKALLHVIEQMNYIINDENNEIKF